MTQVMTQEKTMDYINQIILGNALTILPDLPAELVNCVVTSKKEIRDNSYLIGNQFSKGNEPNVTSFKKGHKTWNKGLKGIHFSPETEFKKGQKGINWKEVGSINCRIDKVNKKRQWIKIEEPNIWIEYAKFIWIKNNGKIPKGYLIHHIDNDILNDDINNLALLTRKGHFEIHKIGEMGRKSLAEKINRRKLYLYGSTKIRKGSISGLSLKASI
jgi:hypothetical protein